MLIAAGALGFESITRARAAWSRAVYVTFVVIATAALAPLAAPILPIETFIRYQKTIGLEPPQIEHHDMGPLPQYFADEFGWEDMAREVARVYYSLTPDERARTAIFGNSYAEAGAIDFYGPKYGLPHAIGNHQNLLVLGPGRLPRRHRDCDGQRRRRRPPTLSQRRGCRLRRASVRAARPALPRSSLPRIDREPSTVLAQGEALGLTPQPG
jgi:hypothetical protein